METETELNYFTACFLYPGVAYYPDDATLKTVLIDKHIEEIANKFVGSPLVIGHNQPTSEDDPIIVGKVTKVFCNTDGIVTRQGVEIKADRKYYCDFYTTTKAAAKAARDLGFVSCSWKLIEGIYPKQNSDGEFEKLSYINLPYEVEAKVVEARHMAIVDDKARYEQAVIYENSTESESTKFIRGGAIYDNSMEIESKVEIEKGIFLTFASSAAEKGRDMLNKIFDNAKKKNSSDEEAKKEANDLEEHEEEEIEEEKKNKKKKMNCSGSMKKNKKKKENAESEDEGMEEEEDVADNSKEEEEEEKKDHKKKSNSIEVDGKDVDVEELKNLYRDNAKKKNSEEEDKDNTKENSVDLDAIQHKALTSSKVSETPFATYVDGASLYGSKHKK